MAIFRRGLKKSVKVELIRYLEAIEDIEDYIKASIDIDDKLYELAIEERYNYRPSSSTGYYNSRGRSKLGKKAKRSDSYSLESIELDLT